MNLSELEKKGLIHRISVDKTQIDDLLKISERDLTLAKEIFSKSFDGALNLAYNSMLQAARALMFSYGYRPDSEFHHKATFDFVSAVLDKKYAEFVQSLNRIRSKRALATYEKPDVISGYEAKYAINSAEEFLKFVREKINEKL
ncbi:MAG: HEPN domain-containing protein [Candidatus Anstonellales archaeon]